MHNIMLMPKEFAVVVYIHVISIEKIKREYNHLWQKVKATALPQLATLIWTHLIKLPDVSLEFLCWPPNHVKSNIIINTYVSN